MSIHDYPIAAGMTATDLGRCGENLVAYVLERNGMPCTVVDRRGTDMWCSRGDGKLITLEVKSSLSLANVGVSGHSFGINTVKADWVAFVSLIRESVIFRPWASIKNRHRVHIRVADFTPEAMQSTFKDMYGGVTHD